MHHSGAGSLAFLLQAGVFGVGLNGSGGETVVVPPAHQRGNGGDAGGDQLLHGLALDGQHGLAAGAQQLIGQGQQQAGGAAMVAAEILWMFMSVPHFLVVFKVCDAVVGHLHLFF